MPLAQVINYQSDDPGFEGMFIPVYPRPKMALAVAAAFAKTIGVDEPTELDEDALDLLGGFMNTVAGSEVSARDKMGVAVTLGTPSNLGETLLGDVGCADRIAMPSF